MKRRITWTQSTTHRIEIDLSDEQLAEWATTAVSGALLASTPETLQGTSADQLANLIRRNHHLRDRLLTLYAQQTLPSLPTPTSFSAVDVEYLHQADDPTS